ncbi:acyl-CoA thioester hydrolase, YbgC/YbaW family [Gottschalkia purinilytica]|uniref:Acyl-CoA thioester hydrolase, YbgC/YbaW family n=1 Tax=Gottschalkia purinilytica TaxID=1503 RepID=A0A0L0WCE0_GOTPU|nr:thioesterase family protein [Gottschalkia purinilytica]KNF09131.1 acyl-CoA thioester hydrolase, YbgC/YbaW family [Gottschalkia purinilytica]
MINETLIRVRYAETDQMGVVYHSNYFIWFEIGRTEFFRTLGMEYKELEMREILVPVVDVGCKYKISAKYDDELIIKTRLKELTSVKLKFEYEIVRKKDESLLATGYTIHAFVSKELRPVNFKKKYRDIWDKLDQNIKEE